MLTVALELEDPEITIDLHEHRSESSRKYDIFWKIVAQFFAGKVADVITAVDKCRYGTVVHLTTAISVNDLLHQIKREYPSETLIPNDKYRCKVGKPSFPVAAIERGKKVIVNKNTTFAVVNYDFTKTEIISRVTIICNIPESINVNFYEGRSQGQKIQRRIVNRKPFILQANNYFSLHFRIVRLKLL
ncbi:hypothetical protein GLOIN_2v1880501 [Rhizophagus clarus]|uniref:Uncharacterized protein n=1 Tax=Rhizophagus clarus TaxID=94130 RepID=A0A8H3KU79_9GLOM|nr:hypothetical protein GLOIN_2v1880501 [Rhizophagus clarus]